MKKGFITRLLLVLMSMMPAFAGALENTNMPENLEDMEDYVIEESIIIDEASPAPEEDMTPGQEALSVVGEVESKSSDFIVENNVLVGYTGAGGSVDIPRGLGIKTIAASAFANNTSITSVTIAMGIEHIEPGAFSTCTNLTRFSVDSSNTAFISGSTDGALYRGSIGSSMYLVAYPPGKTETELVFYDYVKGIDDMALAGNSHLKKVIIYGGLMSYTGVTSIGKDAFKNCASLTSLVFRYTPSVANLPNVPNPQPTFTSGFPFDENKVTMYVPVGQLSSYEQVYSKYPFVDIVEEGTTPDPTDPTDPIEPEPAPTMPTDTGSGGSIIYSSAAESFRVPGDDGAYIDLNDETLHLPDDFHDIAYSVDGGRKWKFSPLSNKQLATLLNKGMTLWMADDYDDNTKVPPSSARIIKFPSIGARPKLEKPTVNYTYYKGSPWLNSSSAEKYDRWTISQKGKEAPLAAAGLQIAYANGTAPSSKGWGSMDTTSGMKLRSGKSKISYLLRIPPVASGGTYTPASKNAKITPVNIPAAPKLKVDYKKSIIKLKQNHVIYAGAPSGLTDDVAAIYLDESTTTQKLTAGQCYIVTGKKGVTIDLSEYIATSPQTLVIWMQSYDKQPTTDMQVIAVQK